MRRILTEMLLWYKFKSNVQTMLVNKGFILLRYELWLQCLKDFATYAKLNLLTGKNTYNITTFNITTLNTINQIVEFRALAAEQNIDIICTQEHRYHSKLELKHHESSNGWTSVSADAWKISINAAIWVGRILTPCNLNPLNSKEKIQPRWICATFKGNPCTTIVSCYSPTNATDETDLPIFYNKLSSLVSHIPWHNVPIIEKTWKLK